MDLNHLLSWLVGTSAGFGLFVIIRRHGRRFMGWIGVQSLILLVLLAGLWRVPEWAGFMAMAVWMPLVLVPTLGNRIVNKLVARRRFRDARRLCAITACFHPFDGWQDIPRLLEALEFRECGDIERAKTVLEFLAKGPSAGARQAYFQLLRLNGDWSQMRLWIEAHLDDPTFYRDTATLSVYMRALGELGEYDLLIAAYRDYIRPMVPRANPRWVANMRLLLAAYLGRGDLVQALLNGPLNRMAAPIQAYWLSTALQTAGESDNAHMRLQMLQEHPENGVVASARQRLKTPLPSAQEATSRLDALPLLADIEASIEDLTANGTLAQPPAGRFPSVTFALIMANFLVFALEIPQGTENPENLFNLGALVAPAAYLQGQWWRVFSSLFLHFGPLHLLMNMLALWYFGRYLERLFGALRFALLYSVSAPGSMLLILAAATWVGAPFHIVVGASGGVMALLGAILATMWVRWKAYGARMAKGDATLLIIMLALQTLFDLTTPEVSFLGHSSGALLGFILGLGLQKRSGRKRIVAASV